MRAERPASPFTTPLLLSTASLAGLVMALVGDGWWNVVAWALVGAPIAGLVWAIVLRRETPEGNRTKETA